ncbi:MAG TPA: mechanosensitive ion channel [Burkholderiaceae bacterium]|nr:mechanosensitive ion channel [Burkholderiaceae bacterium]
MYAFRRGCGAVLLALACAAAAPAGAQSTTSTADISSSTDPRVQAIAPADIPARADADEKFLQAVERRSQALDKVQRFEQSLAQQAESLNRLADMTDSSDLSQLSVRRLESLSRHWLLHERSLTQTRAELSRATNATSEDAADLTRRRLAWQATSQQPYLSPALRQRCDELILRIEQTQGLLAKPLAKMLELGRKANALAAQIQSGLHEVNGQIEEQDRRLAMMDTPPLWQVSRATARSEPLSAGLRRSLTIETAFARDYDATHARLWPALLVGAVLLLPVMFWLRQRARQLAADERAESTAAQALSHPWAAWLLLVAAGALLYDIQGPIMRQQLVMLLAWLPVIGLVQRRVLNVIGPWAYLSAVFYFLNVLVSFIASDPLHRWLLLALNALMLLALAWRYLRWRRVRPTGGSTGLTRLWNLLGWTTCAVLLIAATANILGNSSLSAMLVSATLDSSYAALAIYAGSQVLLALLQVLFAGSAVSRLRSRYAATLMPSAVKLGRTLLGLAWLVFTLQSFRVYRPLSAFATAVLTHEFKIGELTLSLGNVAIFAVATWAAFWLARTIRVVLTEDVLPALSLPRGVGNSISSLSYYSILFIGLLSALAASGFQVGQLTLVFGALGVGIGFGLQDVVRNFVAGLILMFERPIQRGDTVEVAGMTGWVREIGLRATTVTTFEGADVVVPNGMLLADKLVNWTLTGTRRRINIDISTRYGADPKRTAELLVAIAGSVEGVAATPAPAAIMTGLVNGELQFNLRAWTNDRADWVLVRSELAMKVRDGLAAAGIEVPVPQRDLQLRTVPTESAAGVGAAVASGRGRPDDEPSPTGAAPRAP